MKRLFRTVFYLVSGALFTMQVAAVPVSFAGKNCYLGVLHAHTVLSPDFRPQPADKVKFRQLLESNSEERFSIANNPYFAYKRAADFAKLDFLAITDHVHGPEQGQPEYCRHEMPKGGYELIRDASRKINSDPAYKEKFLAIPGMEWSVIDGSNHANIFFANKPVPQQINNGRFRTLFTDYFNSAAFERNNPLLLVQLNHPNQVSATIAYGRNAFSGVQAENDFVTFFKDTYLGIEHINGSSNGGNSNTLEKNAHRDGDGLGVHYRRYLNMGFRLAPIGDHDNHRANWGRHTAARTGVWADGLKPAQFVEAYRARRVYASEDNELAVAFVTGDKWMGSVVRLPAAGELRKFRIFITQSMDTDRGQFQNEGPYVVELISDDKVGGSGARPAKVSFNGQQVSSIRVAQGTVVEFTYKVTPGMYCYLHVRESNGLDSGGKNQDAWTAPIFFRS